MLDILGYRKKVGVIAPSTNTVVGCEFPAFCPTGVSVNVSDYLTLDEPGLDEESSFSAGDGELLEDAVKRSLSRAPDALLCCVGITDSEDAIKSIITKNSDVPVFFPSDAIRAALQALGGVKRVGLIAPNHGPQITAVDDLLSQCGAKLAEVATIEVSSPIGAAHTTLVELREKVEKVDSADIDAILQIGSNLPMARLVEDLERIHGKPVLSLNMTLFWHMLRQIRVFDIVAGFSVLLKDH